MFLRTLGGLELEGTDLRRPKPLLLLVYLAIEGPQERGHLAELFFRSGSRGRASLSTTLSRLRRAASGCVDADDAFVRSAVACDALQLAAALRAGELERGVALYRGRFLAGVDTGLAGTELENWIYGRREALAAQVRSALLDLAEGVAVPGRFGEAAAYAERAYLVSGAPEPGPSELTRLYTLLRAAEHPQAREVRAEAEAFGHPLVLEPEEARDRLLETHLETGVPANPYKGLAHFGEEDAALFFGREAAVDELAVRVERDPFVAVIGASGSGKSSLVFAGLIPRLRGEPGWRVAWLRPGPTPFRALAGALVELLEPTLGAVDRLAESGKLAALLRSGELTLVDLVDRLRRDPPDRRLLLVIDQFEELYTLADEAASRAFVDGLVAALRERPRALRLVTTLRADFMPAALATRSLVDLLQGGEYLLGPMRDAELRAVVEEPARARGVTLEEGLTDRILADVQGIVQGREGGLPLLEFALARLWDRQTDGRLTHHAYDAIGGLERALANHAEAVFQRLSPAEREGARRVLLQLVQPGQGQEDTRRVASYHELEAHWPLVSRLASAPARLLVTGRDDGGEPVAEVIHEALIRHWGRLRRLVDEHRSFRSWQEHLRRDVRRWRAERDHGFLLRGFPLAEAKRQLDANGEHLNAEERRFIEASLELEAAERAGRERRRRERAALRRRVTATLAAGLVVAVALAGLAGWQWRLARARSEQLAEREGQLELALAESESRREQLTARGQELNAALGEAERQERRATYRGLQGHALAAVQGGDYGLAALLAAEGLRLAGSDAAAKRTFSRILTDLPPAFRASLPGNGEGFAVSPDGTLLANPEGVIELIDLATLEVVGELVLDGYEAWTVAFSPDGTTLVSAGEGELVLWDLERREAIAGPRATRMNGPIRSVAISPDGRTVAVGASDGRTELWAADGLEPLGEPLASGTGATWVNWVAFSPDGAIVASAEIFSDISLWDAASHEPVGLLEGHGDSVGRLAFSPDGALLASVGWDETAILWDVAAREQIGEPLTDHGEPVLGVAFSPDGRTLATAGYDKTIRLWEVASRTPVGEPLRGHADELRRVEFAAGGDALVSGDQGGTLIVWDLTRGRPRGEPIAADAAGLALSSDGATLATSSWSGRISLWDATTHEAIDAFEAAEAYVNSVASHPDGRTLASNDPYQDAAMLWDLRTRRNLARLESQPDDTWVVAFSPDGRWLATGGADGDILLNDVATRTPASEPLHGHTERVEGLAFSPDGRLLASAGADGVIGVWDVAAQRPALPPLRGHEDRVFTVAFNPEGAMLASASTDHTVRLWDVATGAQIGDALLGHDQEAIAVAFHPDGSYLASAADDGKILFWNVETRLPYTLPYRSDGPVGLLAFSPDGETLISGGERIAFWDARLEPVDWRARACRQAGRNFTEEEWRRYLGTAPYHETCAGIPSPAA